MKPILKQFTTSSGIEGDTYFDFDLEIAMPVGAGYSSKKVQQWIEYFPEQAIIKCKHCGQYGARYTPCIHCGAPLE